MKKTIGRNADNDFVINQPDVSGHHAEVTMLENDLFEVSDLDSLNKTRINGYPVTKVKFSAFDELKVASCIVKVSELFGPAANMKSESANGYTDGFNSLKKVWDDYRAEVKSIKRRHQIQSGLARLGVILPVIIGSNYLIKDHTITATVSTLATTAGMLVSSNTSIDEKMMDVDDNFSLRYVCVDGCKKNLPKRKWETLAKMGKCPSCGCSFSKNQTKK